VNRKSRTISVAKVQVISQSLDLLLEPNSVAELRVPNARGRTLSGYFNDQSLLAKAASRLSGKARGVYVTLNPVRADLFITASLRDLEAALDNREWLAGQRSVREILECLEQVGVRLHVETARQ